MTAFTQLVTKIQRANRYRQLFLTANNTKCQFKIGTQNWQISSNWQRGYCQKQGEATGQRSNFTNFA